MFPIYLCNQTLKNHHIYFSINYFVNQENKINDSPKIELLFLDIDISYIGEGSTKK